MRICFDSGPRKTKLRWHPAKPAGAWCLVLILSLFFHSMDARGGEEEEEETTVFADIVVKEAPYNNPVTPVLSRYGTQHNVVTEDQITRQSGTDFQSTLRNVPGVMFQSKNLMGSQTSHSLYIRGRGASHPSADFAIEFDGVPRYGAIFGQVLGDGIALSTIGGMEVFKSPQPSQFGSGYASVNILPKYLKEEGQQWDFDFSGGSYGTIGQSLSGGMKQGRYDYYISQSWASTDGHRDHSRAQQQNYYANTGYQLSGEWNVRLLANWVASQTLAPGPDTAPTATNGVTWPGAERYDTETFLTTLSLNHQYEKTGGYIKAYLNETDFDLLQELTSGQRYAGGTDGLWSRQEISLYGLRGKETLHLWPGGEILIGADLDRSELLNTQRTYSGLAVAGINGGLASRVWDYPETTLFSPYVAASHSIGRPDGFHVIPSAGFRYYSHNEFEDVCASQAGLVAGYANTDLNFNYARGVNYPSALVVMNAVVTNSTITDPSEWWQKIKPEVIDHFELGLTHTWPELATLGATVFTDEGKDRFQAYMFGALPTVFNDPIGRYKIRGLELSGTLSPVKGLECFASGTWLDAEATGSDGIERDDMPYTPEVQFQAGIDWAVADSVSVYMDVQHLRGLYQGTVRRSNTFNYAALTDKDKLDDITLFNARVTYRFDYGSLRLKGSELFLALNNIFDERYEYAKGYEMPGATVFAGVSLKFR